jgi:hypothetical protein
MMQRQYSIHEVVSDNVEAFLPSPTPVAQISSREDSALSIQVNLIRHWRRGEIAAPVMSTSSGPKDYFCNLVWDIFDKRDDIESVWLVRGQYASSVTFVLVGDRDGRIWDRAGVEVEMKL